MTISLNELLQYLYCSFRIPVTHYTEHRLTERHPDDLMTIDMLLTAGDPLTGLKTEPGQLLASQFLTNQFNEHYLYIDIIKDNCFLIGPFLLEPMREGEVSNLIEHLKLPINKKTQMVRCYQAFPVVSEQQAFYMGRFLEKILSPHDFISGAARSSESDSDSLPLQQQNYFTRTSKFHHSPFFLEQEVSRMISTGNEESAMLILSKINALHRATLAEEPMRSLKNSLIGSCGFFSRAAIAGGVPSEEAFTISDKYILEIENSNRILELNKIEEKMLRGFSRMVKSLKEIKYSTVVLTTIQYIRDHLTEDLSIPTLARVSYVHPNYLSALFHRETGITLSNYIRKQRIEEAKNYIRYSAESISEIAAFYCFSSQSHFIKAFREETGFTPKQYRSAANNLQLDKQDQDEIIVL